MSKYIHLIIGGASGTIARYLFSGVITRLLGTGFPYGTLSVNLAGCLSAGLLISLSETKLSLAPETRTFLMVGFLGAFTTFSAFILETENLVGKGQLEKAFLNIGLSIVAGYVMLKLGLMLGKTF